jgi:hypothetical protein
MKIQELQLTPEEAGLLHSQTIHHNDHERHYDTYGKVVNHYELSEDQELDVVDLWRLTKYLKKPMINDHYAQSCQDSCLQKIKSALKNEEMRISQNQFREVENDLAAINDLLGTINASEKAPTSLVFLLKGRVLFQDGQAKDKKMLLQISKEMFSEIFDSVAESQIVNDIVEMETDVYAALTFYGEFIQSKAIQMPIYIPHDYILNCSEM